MKVLIWVQYLRGIGHVRRMSLISDSLVAAGAEVTVAFGGFPVPVVKYRGAKLVQLPPARGAAGGLKVVQDESGQPIGDAWKANRSALLGRIFSDVGPDVLILETYPFGRRKFSFELEPLLQMARAQGDVLVVSSVRDILVPKNDPAKESQMADRARKWCDQVLVHGDPDLIPFGATFPYADRVADLIRYTGYVVPERWTAPTGGEGVGDVIVSVGSGAVGDGLLRTALAVRPRTALATAPWRFLLGQGVPRETAEFMRRSAGDGVIVEDARPDFPNLLRGCRLSISQAGYNTVMDVLSARCRAVLVPSAAGGEPEQTVRARLLAKFGAAQLVEEPDLSPDTLTAAVAAALKQAPTWPRTIRMDGRESTVHAILGAKGQLRRAENGQLP